MAVLTNSALAERVNNLVGRWDLREKQYRDWIGGTADGGPFGDGRYPVTASDGTTYYLKSPAALQAEVDGPASTVGQQATDATAAAGAAGLSANTASAAAAQAVSMRDQAQTHATAAGVSKDGAANAEANALVHRQNAAASASAAAASASDLAQAVADADADRIAAELARDEAQAAAANAATFDPANYYGKVEADGRFRLQSVAITYAELDGKPATFPPSAHGHAWSDLSSVPATATRWPTWSEVTSKPTTFAPSAHTHPISDVTNLQDSLNGKANLASPTFTGNVGFGGQVGGAPVDVYVGTAGRVMIRNTSRNINGIESVNAANSAHAAFNIEASSFTFQGNTVWHGGNFDPATKANLASPTFTGGGNPSTPAGYAVTASGGYGGGYRMIDGAVQTSIWTQNDGSIRFGVGNSTSIAEVARFTTTNATFAGTVQAPMFEARGSGKHFRVYDNNLTQPNLELGAGYNNATDRNAWIANRHADGFIEIYACNGGHTFRVGTGGITYNAQQVWHAGNFTPANKLNYRASLEGYAETVTDWNNAVLNGWYMASGAANAPQTGGSWFMARVTQHNPLWIQQEAWVFTAGPSTTRWRRHMNNGTWGAWTADQQFNGVSVAAWPTSPTYRGMMAADGTYMIMTGNGADPTTYVGALGDVTIRPGNNNPNAQVRIANDAFSTIQPHFKLSNNGASWVRQPNIFLRSTDPGAEAAENDLWVW